MKDGGKLGLILKGNRGSSAVVMVCVTLIIILSSALIADIGYAAIERFKLKQNAESVATEGAEILANSRDKAYEYMKLAAVRKVDNLNSLDIRVSDNNREITVSMGKPFKYIFLSLLGFSGKDIKSEVTVKLSCIDSYKGLRPLTIENQNLMFGSKVILSDTPGQTTNILRIFPVDPGSGSFKTDLIYGSRKLFKVGEKIKLSSKFNVDSIEEGLDNLIKKCKHKPACTYDNYVKGCSRIMVLPVIDKVSSTVEDTVTISGFSAFFIEGYNVTGNHVYITGRFIKYTVKSNTSDGVSDFGLSGIRLIR